jgi:hypothetical protein
MENTKLYPKRTENWYDMYEYLKQYKSEHPDTIGIPATYICENGKNLYTWCQNQRRLMRQKKLSQSKIELLDSIDFEWVVKRVLPLSTTWLAMYNKAKQYYLQHDNLRVSRQENASLYTWIILQRSYRKRGDLAQRKILLLDKINMDWEHQNNKKWMQYYHLARTYVKKHGKLPTIRKNNDENERRILSWFLNQQKRRKASTLEDRQLELLETLDPYWNWRKDQWEKGYELLAKFYYTNFDFNVPHDYVKDGVNLYRFLTQRRREFREEKLSKERQEKLNSLSPYWIGRRTRINLRKK